MKASNNKSISVFGLLIMLLGIPVVNASQIQEWSFNVYLDDKAIGYHQFRKTPLEGETYAMDIEAKFDVSFLFLNVYSYWHENTERWQQQCLSGIESSTNDNGELYTLRGSINAGSLYLSDGENHKSLGECVKTFAYWEPAILHADRLLNAQTGRLVDVTVTPLGSENIDVKGEPVLAKRYRLSSDIAEIVLWYAANDYRWLALESTTDSGRTLRYLIN